MAGQRVRLKLWEHAGKKHDGTTTFPLSAPPRSQWTGTIVETRQGNPTVYVVRRDFDGKNQECTARELERIPERKDWRA